MSEFFVGHRWVFRPRWYVRLWRWLFSRARGTLVVTEVDHERGSVTFSAKENT